MKRVVAFIAISFLVIAFVFILVAINLSGNTITPNLILGEKPDDKMNEVKNSDVPETTNVKQNYVNSQQNSPAGNIPSGGGSSGGGSGGGSNSGSSNSQTSNCVERQISYSLSNFTTNSICNFYQGEICVDKTVTCATDIANLDETIGGIFVIKIKFFDLSAGESSTIQIVQKEKYIAPLSTETLAETINLQSQGPEGNANKNIGCIFVTQQVPREVVCS